MLDRSVRELYEVLIYKTKASLVREDVEMMRVSSTTVDHGRKRPFRALVRGKSTWERRVKRYWLCKEDTGRK